MVRATAHKSAKEVTDRSNALHVDTRVFKLKDPKRIAASLKESADHSERPRAEAYRSALSMINSYVHRAGAMLQPGEKLRLDEAKEQFKKMWERPASGRNTALGRKVEKPGEAKPGGPSGQKDKARHDRKHTNR